jgi:hypothetical protein
MTKRLLAGCFLAATLLATGVEAGDRSGDWRFDVYLDDRPIGEHRFAVDHQGERLRVESTADFQVDFLFLTAFRYDHRAVEEWDGDCLARLEARTERNGKALEVEGHRVAGGFLVEGPDGEEALLPDCRATFAYWDPAILQRDRLINAQNGAHVEVSARSLGTEEIQVGDRSIPAQAWVLEAEERTIKLWYDDQGRWLGLESTVEGGRTLRYRLTEPPPALHSRRALPGGESS